MIPILFDYGTTDFSNNGLGRLRELISCKVTEERNGIYECDFEVPVDSVDYELIRPGRIIGCTHDDFGDVQPFEIQSYSEPINGVVSFHAVHISYRLNGGVTYGKNINSLSAAFSKLKNKVPNFSIFEADFTGSAYVAAFDGVPKSIREYLGGAEGSILDTFGGEYEFDKFRVMLHRERGTKKDVTIRYGVNMIDYTDETDYSETFNKVLPYWAGQNSKGKDVVIYGDIQTHSGETYNKQPIVVPLDLSSNFETMPTKAQINAEARSFLTANNPVNPNQTITVDFVKLEEMSELFSGLQKCKLCDSVRVIFPRYGKDAYYKIVKTDYNVLLDRYDEMELGDLSASLSDFISSGSGTFGDSDILGGLYKVTTMAVTVGTITAHGYVARATYAVPSGSQVDGYNLAGIVGVRCSRAAVNCQSHNVVDNNTIDAGFQNTTASDTAGDTTITFWLLWLKGTEA